MIFSGSRTNSLVTGVILVTLVIVAGFTSHRYFTEEPGFSGNLAFQAADVVVDPEIDEAYKTAPRLTLAPGGHLLPIRSSDLSETGHLVTGSDDGTVRIWSIDQNRRWSRNGPDHTFRLPVGDNPYVGRVQAVAITSDGTFVAAGGILTGVRKKERIYIFNARTGEKFQILEGVPDHVQSLDFSDDGRYLAAGMRSRKGVSTDVVRVWKRSSASDIWEQDFEPQDFGNNSSVEHRVLQVNFSSKGMLAALHREVNQDHTVSSYVRYHPVYDVDGNDPSTSQCQNTKLEDAVLEFLGRPEFVRIGFTPDGKQLLTLNKANRSLQLPDNTVSLAQAILFDVCKEVTVLNFDNVLEIRDPTYRPGAAGQKLIVEGGLTQFDWKVDADGEWVGVYLSGGRYIRDGGNLTDIQLYYAARSGAAAEGWAKTISTDQVMGVHYDRKRGQVFYVTTNPEIGSYSESGGRVTQRLESPVVSMRRMERDLRLSDDATRVALQLRDEQSAPGKKWIEFDLETGYQDHVETVSSDISGSPVTPETIASSLPEDDWLSKYGQDQCILNRQNGEPCIMGKQGNIVHAIAISKEKNLVLLGRQNSVDLFDLQGSPLWKSTKEWRSRKEECSVDGELPCQPTMPGEAWQVNLSQDGCLAVVGFGDGTIRWYNTKTAKELLALYLSPDPRNSSWVAWTPNGKFESSNRGGSVLGWLTNADTQQDMPTFSRAENLVHEYNDPSYVRAALAHDVSSCEMLPKPADAPTDPGIIKDDRRPVVTILTPESDDTLDHARREVYVSYSLVSPSGKPVDGVRFQVTSQGYADLFEKNAPQLMEVGSENSVVLPLRPCLEDGGCNITLSMEARTADGYGARATRRFTQGQTDFVATARLSDIRGATRPILHAVLVGSTGGPGSGLPQLKFTDSDVRGIRDMLEAQALGNNSLYSRVTIEALTSDPDQSRGEIKATRKNIIDALDRQVAWSYLGSDRKVAVTYFSGHGVAEGGSKYRFLPMDHKAGDLKYDVTGEELKGHLTKLSSDNRKVMLLDTCKAGASFNSNLFTDSEKALGDDYLVLFASSSNEDASEGSDNSIFTTAILDAYEKKSFGWRNLENAKADHLTPRVLSEYVRDRVKSLTKTSGKHFQKTLSKFPDEADLKSESTPLLRFKDSLAPCFPNPGESCGVQATIQAASGS